MIFFGASISFRSFKIPDFKKNVLGLFFHFSFFLFSFFFLFPLFFSRFLPLPHSPLSTPLFVRAQNLIFFGPQFRHDFSKHSLCKKSFFGPVSGVCVCTFGPSSPFFL